MLENLSERLQGIFSGLRGKGRLTEDDINDAMREIRMALLEADVNFKVVKSFVARTKERCLGAEVLDSLTPAQNVIKIVLDELTELLGRTDSKLVLSSRIPNVIMLVGLQGSGKTTAAAKLAYRLKQENHAPLLVACDVYRPAAADQLQTLGGELGVRVYRGDGQDPVRIAKEGIQDAIDNLRDVVIVDTEGRLHVDDEMMDEATETLVLGCSCAGNPADGAASVNAEVTGIALGTLLAAAEPSADANTIVFTSADGYEVALPLYYVEQRYCPIVFDVNGSPLIESVGGANQLWLGSTSARYFARDIVKIELEERETPPPAPGAGDVGDAYANLPNVGVYFGGEVR